MPVQQLMMSVLLWVAVIAVFYFLLIRPQKKKDKELQNMRDSLSVGDTVVTIGGLVAHVARVEEETVVLEVGPNRTRMTFEKWAIGRVAEKNEKNSKEEKKEDN